jgi:hypothetical protein
VLTRDAVLSWCEDDGGHEEDPRRMAELLTGELQSINKMINVSQ